MASFVLRDQKLWLAQYDLTGFMSSLAVDYGAELQDDTVFGDDTRSRAGGLKTVTAQHEGYFDAENTDDQLFSNIGVADVPMSFGAEGGDEGGRAFTFLANLAEYSPGGSVGEMFAFSVSAESSGDLVRGTLMHNATRSSTGNGTARQLGAVASGQSLYAVLHVLSASGTNPTLDVTIESDDASGMASATERGAFAQATEAGYEWLTPVAGPVTDDWFRIVYTLGGTSPSFEFVVILGIQ